jgi:hypothetical protein
LLEIASGFWLTRLEEATAVATVLRLAGMVMMADESGGVGDGEGC